MSLYQELKRRNVFRVGTLYLVFAWLILQVADVLFGVLRMPEFSLTLVAVILALGFVPAVVLAWVYEVTPDGIRREQDIDRTRSITGQTARKLDSATVFVLVGALAVLGFRQMWLEQGDHEARSTTNAPGAKAATGSAGVNAPAPETAAPAVSRPARAGGDARQSVAVLPFVNMSGDEDNEYFSDGISEELLNVLVQIDALRVPSRTSSFRFKGDPRGVAEIAGELGVEHLLEGSVRKAGDQVRITAQLIHAPTDEHLWSGTFTRTLDDIFAIQEEIAGSIVEALQVALGTDESLETASTSDSDAYEHYLRGRYFWHQRSPAGFAKAEEELRTAVDLDPTFGDAWAALADIYVLLPEYLLAPVDEAIPKARAALDRALAIDPESARALATRAYLRALHDFEFDAAERDFLDAITIDPDYATAHQWYAEVLSQLRRHDDAIERARRALVLDPLAPVMPLVLGNAYAAAGRLGEAISSYEEALRLEPEFFFALLNLQGVRMQQGRIDEARALQRRINDAFDGSTPEFMEAALAALAGEVPISAAADKIIAYDGPVHCIAGRVYLLAMLGAIEDAITVAERCVEEHDPYAIFLNSMHELERARANPRFRALLARINLPVEEGS